MSWCTRPVSRLAPRIVSPVNLGEADDGVEWRAELMGHVGEELRLVPVGGFDLAALVLDLVEQPGVVDRQGGLRRKGLQ